MRKRIIPLLLALLLSLSCLTGCVSKSATAFYDTVDQMIHEEDVLLDLVAPYHGANLLVNGYVCRSSQTADLVFTLEGTGDSDGVWTELRIQGNQFWLNVKQLSQRTLAFSLPNLRRADIEDLEQDQSADWVSYTWQGDFWAGIPDWADLLDKVWDRCKKDLNAHLSGSDGSYVLDLSGSSYQKARKNLLQDLLDRTDAFRQGFDQWTEAESQLIHATQSDTNSFFDDIWTNWSNQLLAIENGEDTTQSLSLTLDASQDSYQLNWAVDQEDGWALTVTPTTPQTPETPETAMEFGVYADATYYLINLSGTYISDVLEGVELDEELEGLFDEPVGTEPMVQPMETGTIGAYPDLATIQFVPLDGQVRTVPILASYQSNSFSTVEGIEGQLVDLSLQGQGWYQFVYSQSADGMDSSQFLDSSIRSYYDAYVDIGGYLLVQDLTEPVTSDQGAMAQGFSYRVDDYSDPIAQYIILLPREGNEGYTVLDLELRMSEMTQADLDGVTHLFDYLGLPLTLDLDV